MSEMVCGRWGRWAVFAGRMLREKSSDFTEEYVKARFSTDHSRYTRKDGVALYLGGPLIFKGDER